MTWASLSLSSAHDLVDLGEGREAQLEGAVAMHNILQRERVAYLADEVGLGKTYVALTTLALFRHFQPGFRVLVLAPRRNIQHKWAKDWRSFVRHNWKATDLRVRGASGTPTHPVRLPERLSDLVPESVVQPRDDHMARLSSFSTLGSGSRPLILSRLARCLPWIDPSELPHDRDPHALRCFLAQAYNVALPPYDLVIIDEAHNLKHGVTFQDGRPHPHTSQRNTALSQLLGHRETRPFECLADGFRPLANRVLLLSATPVEDSLDALWRQVHLVDKHLPPGRPDLSSLKNRDRDAARASASRVLVRRVNAIKTATGSLTKNQYRQTWGHGGVSIYDEPLPVDDARARLTVALVQKRVSDVLGTSFNNSFQMGMLASFESFQETALTRTPSSAPQEHDGEGEADESQQVFDGSLQTEDELERRGADVDVVNALARSHRDRFGSEMAHPKMDALVDELATSWETGRKTLVFVRRVRSVDELKRRLDERYDQWLLDRLRSSLPGEVWSRLQGVLPDYRRLRLEEGLYVAGGGTEADRDGGGADTLFAWFFRGTGPDLGQCETGATVATRTGAASGTASTAFARHLLSDLLQCPPERCLEEVAQRIGSTPEAALQKLTDLTAEHLPPSAGRRDQFDAVQHAGLRLLAASGDELARILVDQLQISPRERGSGQQVDVGEILLTPTFFTLVSQKPALRRVLGLEWPQQGWDVDRLTAHVLHCALLTSAVRLGHPLIDLYEQVTAVVGAGPWTDAADVDASLSRFVDELERQRRDSDTRRGLRELEQITAVRDEIRRINLPATESEDFHLHQAPRECADLLGRQQPTAGLAGRVNARAVRQFRMPGYPYAMICTDVLQEGEDLHTFCDRVVHYGVAWTASAMEQRIGRVDRIQSLAERRLRATSAEAVTGKDKIQVQLPYLGETIERLQARRVLDRMHSFVELMHEGVSDKDQRVDINAEMLREEWRPPTVTGTLSTSFPVLERDLQGRARASVRPADLDGWFDNLVSSVQNVADLEGEPTIDRRHLVVLASLRIAERVQPFAVRLDSSETLPLAVVTTPIGRRKAMADDTVLETLMSGIADRVVLIDATEHHAYDLSLAGDTILTLGDQDPGRVAGLIRRLTHQADQLERALTSHDLELAQVDMHLREN